MLIKRNETVCVAESSSGGLISACLLSFPGASKYFVGGSVLYSYQIREAIVNMGEKEHAKYGGSTPELVSDLASHFRNKLSTTWCIGEAGASGPTNSPYGHPAGYTALAIQGPVNQMRTFETKSSDRIENMMLFTREALQFFLSVLKVHSENL